MLPEEESVLGAGVVGAGILDENTAVVAVAGAEASRNNICG